MADHQVENNSDGVSSETKPFGSLKNYWENMSNQRMEADCSVPSRPNVVVPTKTEKVSKHACIAPILRFYLHTYLQYIPIFHQVIMYFIHTYMYSLHVC